MRGHDVLESRAGGKDPGDRVLLAWAVSENRILITMDKDFGGFVFHEKIPHCGLVRLPDVPAGTRISLMEEVIERHSQDLEAKSIITVRGGRIRISRVE
jgi:predicted nuclease of predicted toxin-antitoxin system